MAERGKTEESQHTERPARVSDAEMLEVVDHIQAVFGNSARVQFSVQVPAAGAPYVDVLVEAKDVPVEAKPAQAKAEAEQARVETRAVLSNIWESDEPVERDDAYYDEVRQAVGRGTLSVLLGTPTKSLDRALERLWVVHGASGTSPTARRPLIGSRWDRLIWSISDLLRRVVTYPFYGLIDRVNFLRDELPVMLHNARRKLRSKRRADGESSSTRRRNGSRRR